MSAAALPVPWRRNLLAPFSALVVLLTSGAGVVGARTYDVVVYGGTSAGVIAAVQAARMGKSTILIEPSRHFGGMTSGGLSLTDIGDPTTVGGLAREFYAYIYQYYNPRRTGTRYQAAVAVANPSGLPDPSQIQWAFEPHVAENVFRLMLHSARVATTTGERLNRASGVVMANGRIVSIQMTSGRIFSGKMFIDATYEGDLMAAAGISCRVGRESMAEYGEALAGVFPGGYLTGQVDPYVVPGDPASGLLPGVDPVAPGPEGTGDGRVQQYNLRLCFTADPSNQAAITMPNGYDPLRYELLVRYLQKHPDCPLDAGICKFGGLPAGKVNVNSCICSTDMPGSASYGWAEASDDVRASILQDYQQYTQGLFWFLANDPRVPDATRAEAALWGPAKDEFTDNGNWPRQLYVREARRMVGTYVMTEQDAEGTHVPAEPVALGSYGLDSHAVTYSTDATGALTMEGSFFEWVNPYPISYGALTPQASQCQNLLVPVCLSATHVAIDSLRMEPVYMMLGQAAATGACLALDQGVAAQDVAYAALASRLQADGQILSWTPPAADSP